MYRQGDVFLIPISESKIPKKLKPVQSEKHPVEGQETDCFVFAYGEVTGHAHVIEVTDEVTFLETDQKDMADRFLKVEAESVLLRHEEHRTLEIPEGTYMIRRQREWTADAPRFVAD